MNVDTSSLSTGVRKRFKYLLLLSPSGGQISLLKSSFVFSSFSTKINVFTTKQDQRLVIAVDIAMNWYILYPP